MWCRFKFFNVADTFIIISVILQILTIGVLIAFVVALIKLIKALTGKIENLSDDVLDLKKKAEPLIENSAKFLNTANRVADSIDKNMDTITSVVDSVKDTVKKITDFTDDVRSKVEPPVIETIASYTGIVKGIKVFIDAIKNRSGMYHKDEERQEDRYDDDYNLEFDAAAIEKQRNNRERESDDFTELDNINAELNELRRKIAETE